MTKTQKLILWLLSATICVLLVLIVGVIIYTLPTPVSTSVQSNNLPTPVRTSPPLATQSPQLWVIYEVLFVSREAKPNPFSTSEGGNVNITWTNNTGGTNQLAGYIGDGVTYNWSSNATPSYVTTKPFRIAYTAYAGEIFSLVAQSEDDTLVGGLVCNIYLADTLGKQCMIDQGRNYCGKGEKITAWRNSSCSGQYCICQISGMVGSGQ